MRIALLTHDLPPRARTGVETHVAALAAALGGRGFEVLVIAPRAPARPPAGRLDTLPHLAERCEAREGYRVHWLQLAREPADAGERLDPPGVAEAVGELLDRERPDLAHVHHLAGLGAGVLDELARRRIPTVFTAHDHWAVCHRHVLLRPDLERCTAPGVARACARCDRAEAFLNGLPGLGDYQAGVFAESLEPGDRRRLADRLGDGARTAHGPGLEAVPAGAREQAERTAALVTRRGLAGRRRRLLARIDRALAPTRMLADELEQAGVPAGRIAVSPYGVERELLEALPRPAFERVGPDRPLRFGFVGGLSKHKGAHVLLEAFAARRVPATLELFGESTDAPHVARLAGLARISGARLRGGFDAGALPSVLDSIDVLCVPSIWGENAPFVIREAFAAGRPVIASRLGALEESVRDGVDGLLVPPGDAEAWREALDGLAAEPARAASLAAGVRAPRSLGDQVDELAELYRELVGVRAAVRAGQAADAGAGLPHLAEAEARWREVRAETLDALRARALYGLERLTAGLRKSGALEERAEARKHWPTPTEGELQDRARDRRRELEWLRRQLRARDTERAGLAGEVDWLRGALTARAEECAWLRERAAGAERAAESLGAEVGWLRAGARDAEAEVRWLREQLAAREDELAWQRGVARDHAEARAWYRGLAERALGAGALGLHDPEPQANGRSARAEPEGRTELRARDEELRS